MSIFGKPKYTVVKVSKRKGVPDGTWIKCNDCGEMIYKKTLDENFKVCPKCNYHFVLSAPERIDMFLDKDSFEEFEKDMLPRDVLKFQGPKSYKEKIEKDTLTTGMVEAAVIGKGRVNNRRIALGVTDSRFIMGSMGYVVGEKIAIITEYATKNELPLADSTSRGA